MCKHCPEGENNNALEKKCSRCQSEYCCRSKLDTCKTCTLALVTTDVPANFETQQRCTRCELSTQHWGALISALIADLERIASFPEGIRMSGDLARPIAATLLYRMHVASFQNFDYAPIEVVRQESRLEKDCAEVYARSQSAGHPLFYLLNLLFGEETQVPFNKKVFDLLRKAAMKESQFDNWSGKVSVTDDVTRYHDDPSGEVPGAHAGLRKSNTEVITRAVAIVLKDPGLSTLTSRIRGLRDNYKASALRPPSASITSSTYPGLLNTLDDVQHLVNDLVDNTDPVTSDSFVTRKLKRSAAMADHFVKRLSQDLKCFTVSRLDLHNPLITAELKHIPALPRTTFNKLVGALRIYFAVLTTRRLASAGVPLSLGLRQSFGFLDTTLANTEPSIRISTGTEPVEYFAVAADAFAQMDTELSQALGTGDSEEKFKCVTSLDRPNSLITTAAFGYGLLEANDLEQFLEVIRTRLVGGKQKHPELDNPEVLRHLEQRAWEHFRNVQSTVPTNDAQQLFGDMLIFDPLSNILFMAETVITIVWTRSLHCQLLNGSWQDYAFANTGASVVEILKNTVDCTKVLLTKMKDAGSGTALERLRYHALLRNAAEDIAEASLVVLAIFDWTKKQLLCVSRRVLKNIEALKLPPEKCSSATWRNEQAQRALKSILSRLSPAELRCQDEINQLFGSNICSLKVIRTDSGEQAFAVVIASLQIEKGDKHLIMLRLTPDHVYYEYPKFVSESYPNARHPSRKDPDAIIMDPCPFLSESTSAPLDIAGLKKAVEDVLKNKRDRLLTLILDGTSYDYTLAVPALKDLVQRYPKMLRIVLVNSLLKHEQLSLDKHHIGRVITIGPPLKDSESSNDNVLINQMLHLLHDLRDLDSAAFQELTEIERNLTSPQSHQAETSNKPEKRKADALPPPPPKRQAQTGSGPVNKTAPPPPVHSAPDRPATSFASMSPDPNWQDQIRSNFRQLEQQKSKPAVTFVDDNFLAEYDALQQQEESDSDEEERELD